MDPEADMNERCYKEITSLDEMNEIVLQCLDDYNNTHKTRMNLVIFRSAVFGCMFFKISGRDWL